MSITPNQNGNYPVKKNDVIFLESQNTQSVNILLQGKTDIFISSFDDCTGMNEEDVLKKSYRIFTIGQNMFLGSNDLFLSEKYSFSYRAAEDAIIYLFATQDLDQVKSLMNVQKDYGAYFITSISTLIDNSYSALKKLESFTREINILTDNLIIYFWLLKEEYNFNYTPSSSFFREALDYLQKMNDNGFSKPGSFNPNFFETDHSDVLEKEYVIIAEINESSIDYYKQLSNLPLDIRKSFFGADVSVTTYQCMHASNLLNEIQSELKSAFKMADTYFKRLYSESEECIFSEFINASLEIIKNNANTNHILQVIEYIAKKIWEIALTYESEYLYKCDIDMEYFHSMRKKVKAAAENPQKAGHFTSHGNIEINGEPDTLPEELKDSVKRIIEYSNIPKERADLFLSNLLAFRELNDKFKLDSDTSSIRNSVSSVFFEIYEAVLKRTVLEQNNSRLYSMFLNYAYMDEKLLDLEHVLSLYKLSGKTDTGSQKQVYGMKDWMTKIYNMEKDPSISEFGLDYFDVFREMKRRKQITDKDKIKYENDVDKRLNHEVFNMFRVNQKLCHGQISVYFPILHNEMITRDLSKAVITLETINESLNKILEIDFSVFHREVFYNNAEKGIEKELIMKAFLPDIILMPTFGTRSMMWQELTGRNRSSPGRFIFPTFTGENLDDILLKLIGNFRWELCRTMMGVAWNDITQKSLTSEYTDYIQFYRKNKDLSEEAKDKVKSQIQKHRNMMRDIFTADYEIWINYESKGIRRLNKVVRSILYKYCPLSKPIRDILGNQPMYSDLATKFSNLRAKHSRELENRYAKLVKNGSTLDPELEENLRFFKEL